VHFKENSHHDGKSNNIFHHKNFFKNTITSHELSEAIKWHEKITVDLRVEEQQQKSVNL
jgi:hypothetical protein